MKIFGINIGQRDQNKETEVVENGDELVGTHASQANTLSSQETPKAAGTRDVYLQGGPNMQACPGSSPYLVDRCGCDPIDEALYNFTSSLGIDSVSSQSINTCVNGVLSLNILGKAFEPASGDLKGCIEKSTTIDADTRAKFFESIDNWLINVQNPEKYKIWNQCYQTVLGVGPSAAALTPMTLFQQQPQSLAVTGTAQRPVSPSNVPQNIDSLKQDAEAGYAKAQLALAEIYFQGITTPVDLKQAFFWYKKAADAGQVDALYKLAMMYQNGQGVIRDDFQAFSCHKTAADQGHIEASYAVGRLSYFGTGVERNFAQAVRYLQKAASANHLDAIYLLSSLYANPDYYGAQESRARQYLELAAKNGHTKALLKLAIQCFQQDNDVGAFDYFSRAAEQGSGEAAVKKALLLEFGEGTTRNPQAAFEIYAANNEYGRIGHMYETGYDDFARSYDKAFEYYVRGYEESGFQKNAFDLAKLLSNPDFSMANPQKALQWFREVPRRELMIPHDDTLTAIHDQALQSLKDNSPEVNAADLAEARQQIKRLLQDATVFDRTTVSRKANAGGDRDAIFAMGDHAYFNDKTDEAIAWYTKGSGLQDNRATYMLAVIHGEIDGQHADASAFRDYLCLAAKQGHVAAQNEVMRDSLLQMANNEPLPENSVSVIQDLATDGDAMAQYLMGWAAYSSLTPDYRIAQEWFGKAAAQGYLDATMWGHKAKAFITEPQTVASDMPTPK